MAFGVDINEVISKIDEGMAKPDQDSSTEHAPEPANAGQPEPHMAQQSQQGQQQAEAQAQVQKDLLLQDLVKDQKFKWQDQEWTLKDLEKAVMRQRDYTQKTKELATQRKEYESVLPHKQFWENLEADVAKVVQNPQLAHEFKQVYPEGFHKYISAFEGQPDVGRMLKGIIEREITPIKSQLNEYRESQTQAQADALVSQMEAWDSELQKKYSDADIKMVYSILEDAKAQGTPVSKETWEQAWKASHEHLSKLIDERASSRFKQTKTNNAVAKDTKAGGATPGQAPAKVPFNKVKDQVMDYILQQQQAR